MKDMFLIALEGASLVTEHTYIYLLIPVCLIYLFFRNKMPAPRIFFIQGTLLLFFIYFCPISAMVIHFCLLNSVRSGCSFANSASIEVRCHLSLTSVMVGLYWRIKGTSQFYRKMGRLWLSLLRRRQPLYYIYQ